MVIIGGTANLFGTVIGVALVVLPTPFFENVIHLSTNTTSLSQELAYGLALVVDHLLPAAGICLRRLPRRWSERPRVADVAAAGAPVGRAEAERVPAPAGPLVDRTARRRRGLPVVPAGDGRRAAPILKVRNLSKSFGGNVAVTT